MRKPDYRETIKKENRERILFNLKEKGNLTFKALLDITGLARSTLAFHLKELLENGKIEKFYNVYQITRKGYPEAWVEGTIQYLGTVAVYFIMKTKLNLPIEEEADIYKEIEKYLKEEPKDVTFRELLEYLEKEYPLLV